MPNMSYIVIIGYLYIFTLFCVFQILEKVGFVTTEDKKSLFIDVFLSKELKQVETIKEELYVILGFI